MEPELRFGRALEEFRTSKESRSRHRFWEGHDLRPKELTWSDAEDIGILLSDTHPTVDPLAIRFTDLHKYVTALPDFKDDPAKSNEAKLEAIQMAWHSEVLDRTQG